MNFYCLILALAVLSACTDVKTLKELESARAEVEQLRKDRELLEDKIRKLNQENASFYSSRGTSIIKHVTKRCDSLKSSTDRHEGTACPESAVSEEYARTLIERFKDVEFAATRRCESNELESAALDDCLSSVTDEEERIKSASDFAQKIQKCVEQSVDEQMNRKYGDFYWPKEPDSDAS